MGARGLDPPRIRWEPYNLMGHSKTNPAGVWLAQFDERAPDSSVWTINGVTPDTVIIDMGQVRDITHFATAGDAPLAAEPPGPQSEVQQ